VIISQRQRSSATKPRRSKKQDDDAWLDAAMAEAGIPAPQMMGQDPNLPAPQMMGGGAG